MADKDNIDKKIKEGFGDLKGKAPADLWSKLNDRLDDDAVDSFVKKGFEHQNQRAPEQIWKEVNKQLTIDRAWKGVHRMLNWRTAWRRTRQVAALLLLLLLIFWGGNSLFNNDQEMAEHVDSDAVKPQTSEVPADNHHPEVVVHESEAADNDKVDDGGADANHHSIAPTSELETNDKGKDTQLSASTSNAVAEKPDVEERVVENSNDDNIINTGNSRINTVPEGIVIDLNDADSNTPAEFDSNVNATNISGAENEQHGNAVKTFIDKIPNRVLVPDKKMDKTDMLSRDGCVLDTLKDNDHSWGLDVGVIYALNKTSLMNNETRSSFDKKSLISSSASFEGAYGATASLICNDKHGINVMGYFQSRTTQQYGLYVEGRYADKVITLDYGKVALAYQRNVISKSNDFRKLKSSLTFKGGVYYGWLKTMSVNYIGTNHISDDNYTKADIGLILQAGQDLRLNHFIFGYGLNLEQGLKNIYSGNAEIPSYFNRTVTFNAGVYLNFRYRF